jgi:hypothetical protein
MSGITLQSRPKPIPGCSAAEEEDIHTYFNIFPLHAIKACRGK